MKYFPLVWAGLWRKPTRTILTLLSISVAFLLFGMLHGVTTGFETGVQQMSDTRLRVQSRAGILAGFPVAHIAAMEKIDGVAGVGYIAIFPGWYQTRTTPMGAAAIEMDRFFEGFPDVAISEEYRLAMLANRRGALIGEDLAIARDWHVGDTVTLTTDFWQKADGGHNWDFEIVGTYRFKTESLPANEFWFHYEYLDEARTRDKGMVNLCFVTIDDANAAGRIAAEIDKTFINSTYPTLSQNEKDWLRGRIQSIGNIEFLVNAIIGSVLFTLLFLTGNTMMQSVRERIPELAIMKTYGFSNLTVVMLIFTESAILCVFASLAGLGLAALAFPTVFSGLGIGAIPIPFNVIRDGVVMALLLALVGTVPPAWRSQRLNVVDALARR